MEKKMRPISPAPRYNRPPSGGFTLVEVLVALVMLTLLALTVCSSLMTAWRAEGTARELQHVRRVRDTLACAIYLNQAPTNTMKVADHIWQVHSEPHIQTLEGTNYTWTVWHFSAGTTPMEPRWDMYIRAVAED